MQPFILEHKDEIAALCRQHHVRRLSVFGSAARDDFDPERSDVDMLVDFGEAEIPRYIDHFVAVRTGLESFLRYPVQLIHEGVITNLYRVRSIEHDRVELYAA